MSIMIGIPLFFIDHNLVMIYRRFKESEVKSIELVGFASSLSQ